MNSFTCPRCAFVLIDDDEPEDHCPECGFERPAARLAAVLGGERPAPGQRDQRSLPPPATPGVHQQRRPERTPFVTGLLSGALLAVMVTGAIWLADGLPQRRAASHGTAESETPAVTARFRDLEARATEVTAAWLEARADLERSTSSQIQAEKDLTLTQGRLTALEAVHRESLQLLRAAQSERDTLRDDVKLLEEELHLASNPHRTASLRRWLILGPLPAVNLNREHTLPEREPFRPDLQLDGLRERVGWRLHESQDDRINLDQLLSCNDIATAYLTSWVYMPAAQRVQFSIGSDDGCIVWVNRDRCFQFDSHRSASPGQNKTTTDLQAGWNELLVHVDNRGSGQWALYFEVRSEDGSQPLPLIHSCTPPPTRQSRRRATQPRS